MLSYLGYGNLDTTTWVAPRPSDQLDVVLEEAGVAYDRFSATHTAGTLGAAALVGRAWDLDALDLAYRQFVAEQQDAMAATAVNADDETSYAARFRLVNAWRGFLFRDPQLPADLLPEPWSGTAAAHFFDYHEARLRPAADRFVTHCLTT
jgi:phenylacetic acid degradation operon negative regulatory protein